MLDSLGIRCSLSLLILYTLRKSKMCSLFKDQTFVKQCFVKKATWYQPFTHDEYKDLICNFRKTKFFWSVWSLSYHIVCGSDYANTLFHSGIMDKERSSNGTRSAGFNLFIKFRQSRTKPCILYFKKFLH